MSLHPKTIRVVIVAGIIAAAGAIGADYAQAHSHYPTIENVRAWRPGEYALDQACMGGLDINGSPPCQAFAADLAHSYAIPEAWGGSCPITPPADMAETRGWWEWWVTDRHDVIVKCQTLVLGEGWQDGDKSYHQEGKILEGVAALVAAIFAVGWAIMWFAVGPDPKPAIEEDEQAAIEAVPTPTPEWVTVP